MASRRNLTITLCAIVLCASVPARAQDLLNDTIPTTDFRLHLQPVTTLPNSGGSIVDMTRRPGDSRLYVTSEQGVVHTVETGSGPTSAVEWFDARSAIQAATGRGLFGSGSQQGFQSIAFHPQFDQPETPGYGKFFSTFLHQRPFGNAGLEYLGNSERGSGVNADTVLAEWTFDHDAGGVDSASYRELFRVEMPKVDHPIKQVKFNPYAASGDDDYGLLYLTHGDSNDKHSPNDDPQDLGDALGKMLRINPLQDGDAAYSIPASNPFADGEDPGVLKEVYAYGFRNPHTFSFNRDDNGQVHILAGDIGRNNIEEVNRVLPGANYGWTKREGTFVHLQNPDNAGEGYISGIEDLPGNEADFGYTYPVAQYDHDAEVGQRSSGNAIATGHVLRNGSDPDLHNQLLLADFARRDGYVMVAGFDAMLDATIGLDNDNAAADEPGELTQAPLRHVPLALDHDNNAETADQLFDGFLDLLSRSRADTRFGEGPQGEVYISSKQNRTIYLVTNTLPLAGDYNQDGAVDASDYAVWRDGLGQAGFRLAADGNADGLVDQGDYVVWRQNFGRSWGDPPAGATPAPEPMAIVLLTVGTLCLGPRRRAA